MVTTADIN